ncbi:MAG: phytoene desaturase [Gammaproteobacteria bacterium]|nr:phytoene desaturase [Gammaproteobacteria bacterium]
MKQPGDIAQSADPRAHAVVIGSGVGGLAAAVRLGARGYRVTVLEQLDGPGGRARVHRQDGFTFDAGPTIVTAPFLFEELWDLCGRRFADEIDLRPLDPFYRIRYADGSTLDCRADDREMVAQIARLSPDDVQGYLAFLRASEAVYGVAFEQLGSMPFDSALRMLRLAPKLLRMQGHRSLHAVVARHVRDPRLRFALSFHPLFVGGNPFRTTAIYALISHLERRHGVHYPIGGIGRIVDGMVGLIRGQGGAVRYRSRVASIAIERGRAVGVRLAGGEAMKADLVVSDADAATTYGELVGAPHARRWSPRRLRRARYSMSLFVWYFGTRGRYEDVPHHTILVGPRYRGLLRDIFDRKVLADDFSLYLHRPSASDPTVAPEGMDAFYALSPVPDLDAGIDWTRHAEPYRRAIEARLSATVLPGLAGRIVTSRVLTPQGFRDELGSYRGAAFSLAPNLTQSAWFRPHNRSEDVESLYLVGAGTHPGAGLPGVLCSARVLDKVVPDASHVRS